jgi:hypothetical protein
MPRGTSGEVHITNRSPISDERGMGIPVIHRHKCSGENISSVHGRDKIAVMVIVAMAYLCDNVVKYVNLMNPCMVYITAEGCKKSL